MRGFSARQDPFVWANGPTKCGWYLLASSLTAALPAERRVLARRGWAGENRGLFEHPHPAKGEIYRLLERTGISFPSVED